MEKFFEYHRNLGLTFDGTAESLMARGLTVHFMGHLCHAAKHGNEDARSLMAALDKLAAKELEK